MAEGINYSDVRQPFVDVETSPGDFPAVTGTTTSKMLVPAAIYGATGGASYWWVGKKLYLWATGKVTTGGTPGNLVVEIRLGTTDAGGTILATSAATALAANKTDITWMLDAWIVCRAMGASTNGKLLATGRFVYDGAGALFTTTSQNPLLIPASANAEVGVDLTAASGISLQAKNSGANANTYTVQDYLFQPLN